MVKVCRAERNENGRCGDEARFLRLVEAAPDIVVVLDPALIVRYASPAVERALGHRTRDFVGSALPEYLSAEEQERAREVLIEGGAGEIGSRATAELRVRHADGSWRLFEVSPVDLLDDPEVRGIAAYFRDVTAERELRRELAHRSFHDYLTGLPNRALFMNRLEHVLAGAARRQGSVTVLFVDLDDLKAINDGFGHEVGDAAIIAIGRRLQSCVRPGDTVARLGGDEYAVLLEHADDPIDVTRILERIMRVVREPVAVRDHRLSVTASVGAATGEPGGDLGRDLLRRADLAMYRAKRGGKDGFELFEEAAFDIAQRSRWLERGLRDALERGGLRIHYQPRVALGTGEILGMEALLRWEYPRCGAVPPAEVIALAEMSGLMGPLGRWVLEEACRQALVWQDRYPDAPPLMSVNLSAGQLRQPTLADEVAAALRKTGLDPRNLALEAEEAFPADDIFHTAATAEKLGELGVNLIVDDFGAGHSSLYSAGRFPVDMLKIDQRFIEKLGSGEQDAERLVSAMIDFAKALGIRSVAEGVETARQSARLCEMGCELAQGYYFWRPLPGDAATRLLDREKKRSHRVARGAGR